MTATSLMDIHMIQGMLTGLQVRLVPRTAFYKLEASLLCGSTEVITRILSIVRDIQPTIAGHP